MYCPKCGQQQIADEMRFCSRCGLPINGLAEWVSAVSRVVPREETPLVVLPSPRRKGIKRGGKVIFAGFVLVPLFLFISIVNDSPEPLLVPFTVCLAGLLLLLYALIFSDRTAPAPQPVQPSRLGAFFGSPALPPAANLHTTNLAGQPVKTSELVEPPSVTENTTKLLKRDRR